MNDNQNPISQNPVVQPVFPQDQVQNQSALPGVPLQPIQDGQPIQNPSVPPAVQNQPIQDTQQPVSPISTPVGGKETLSIPAKPQTEWVQETASEAQIEEELQEAGVEATKGEVMDVAPEVSQAGVQSVGAAAPLPEEPTLKFPMTEEKAKGILRMHKKVKDSIYWLAMLVVRQFKMLQFQKKEKKEAVA